MAQKPVDQASAGAWWGEGQSSNGQYVRSPPEAKQINNAFGYQGTTCIHGNTVSTGVASFLLSLTVSVPALESLQDSVCDRLYLCMNETCA